jgi:hypothetical protein
MLPIEKQIDIKDVSNNKKSQNEGPQMSKVNVAIANLLILICIFWLNSSGLSAGNCPGGECPGTLSTITGDTECNPDWKPKWESSNPPEVSPGHNVTLNFGEGNRPYTVSVTGNDFWLDQAHTVTTINNNFMLEIIPADRPKLQSRIVVIMKMQDMSDLRQVNGDRGRMLKHGQFVRRINGVIQPTM